MMAVVISTVYLTAVVVMLKALWQVDFAALRTRQANPFPIDQLQKKQLEQKELVWAQSILACEQSRIEPLPGGWE